MRRVTRASNQPSTPRRHRKSRRDARQLSRLRARGWPRTTLPGYSLPMAMSASCTVMFFLTNLRLGLGLGFGASAPAVVSGSVTALSTTARRALTTLSERAPKRACEGGRLKRARGGFGVSDSEAKRVPRRIPGLVPDVSAFAKKRRTFSRWIKYGMRHVPRHVNMNPRSFVRARRLEHAPARWGLRRPWQTWRTCLLRLL